MTADQASSSEPFGRRATDGFELFQRLFNRYRYGVQCLDPLVVGGVAGGHTQAFAVEPGAGIANKAGVAYAHPGFRRFGFAGHAGDGLFFVKAVQGHHRA